MAGPVNTDASKFVEELLDWYLDLDEQDEEKVKEFFNKYIGIQGINDPLVRHAFGVGIGFAHEGLRFPEHFRKSFLNE